MISIHGSYHFLNIFLRAFNAWIPPAQQVSLCQKIDTSCNESPSSLAFYHSKSPFSHSIFKWVCRKIGYCISNSDGLSTFYRHFPYWNWPWACRKFLHDLHTIHIHSSQASHTFQNFLAFLNGFHPIFPRSSWVFPMIFAADEALGAAGEELQIQVVCQQGRGGPGVLSPLFLENLGKKVGKIHGFYIWNLGKNGVFFFPWNQIKNSWDFHMKSRGSKVRNGFYGFYHQNFLGFTLCEPVKAMAFLWSNLANLPSGSIWYSNPTMTQISGWWYFA